MSKTKIKMLQPLPILRPSHAPRHRHHYAHLRNEQEHAAHVREYMENEPEFFKYRDPPPLPYGVWVCEDGTQILFDSAYRPIWQRAEGQPAVRADPKAWFDWCKVYWLDDGWTPPSRSQQLRDMLALIVDEFRNGGSLWVRRWWPESKYAGKYMGELVKTVPARPRGIVIPFREKPTPKETS